MSTRLYVLDSTSVEICMTDLTPAELAEVEAITRDYSGRPLPTLDEIRTDILEREHEAASVSDPCENMMGPAVNQKHDSYSSPHNQLDRPVCRQEA
jgi:hypothetical protein